MAIGYVIVNQENLDGQAVYNEGSPVYYDRLLAEKEAKHLRQKHHSRVFNVYELADPGIVYVLSEEDVFEIARQKRVSKKRVKEEMEQIQKGIEGGFCNWDEIVGYAIDEAIQEE